MLNKSKEQAYYEYLHNVYRPIDLYQIKHNNIYIYNIPKDIIRYIYFQNKQIHIKKEHPESLSEKLLYCKYYIEIDINYFKFLQFGMLGGEIIGINQSIYNPDNNRSNIGIGFALPSNYAIDFINKAKQKMAAITSNMP